MCVSLECAAQLRRPPGWPWRMLGLLPQAVRASFQVESTCKCLLRACYASGFKLGAGGTRKSHTGGYSLFVPDSGQKASSVLLVMPPDPLYSPQQHKPRFSSPQAQALSLFLFLYETSTALNLPLAFSSS